MIDGFFFLPFLYVHGCNHIISLVVVNPEKDVNNLFVIEFDYLIILLLLLSMEGR